MKGSILAFISIMFFSLYAIFGKILLESISPFAIVVLNQLLAYIVLFFFLKLKKELRRLTHITKKDFKIMYCISLFSAFGGPLLFLIGLKFTSATNTILIGKTEAVLTSLLAVWFLREKITIHQVAGALTMFFGILIITTNIFTSGLTFNPGDLIILGSASCFAIGTVLFKKYTNHLPPEIIITIRNLCGATLLFVVSLFVVDYTTLYRAFNFQFVLALVGLVIFTTILGQYLWYKALDTTSATNVSLVGLSSPLIAVFYIVIFLKESITAAQIFGGFFIVIGLILLEFHFSLRPKKVHQLHLKLKHWPHG